VKSGKAKFYKAKAEIPQEKSRNVESRKLKFYKAEAKIGKVES
jgi:hypothetical protein